MSTVAQLIDATLNRWLYGTYRTRTNVLAADISPTDTTVPLKFPPDTIGKGSLLAIDDELIEVIGTAQGQNLPVIRAMRGTSGVPHTAPAMIEINPRYPRLSVRAAMLDELCAWPESLFSVQTVIATAGFPTATIDASDLVAPLNVRRVLAVWEDSNQTSSDDRWFPTDWNSAKDARGPGTCDIYLSTVPRSVHNYRIILGTDFVTAIFDDATNLQYDVGVPRSAEDVLQLGCAWRLVTGHEAKRLYTEQQGESRDAAEVGPLDLARFGQQLMGMRDAGIAREVKRLMDRYGTGITGG